MMKTEVIRADHPIAIPHAVDILNHGGVVAFPTDTVYGLASLPFAEADVERLYTAKGRSNERAIGILIGEISQLSEVAPEISAMALRLAEQFWPGPLTLVVRRLAQLPDVLSPLPTVGVRIPDHPLAVALLKKTGPLAVTSANLSGGDNTVTASEVLAQLDGRIHLLLDGGRAPGGVPSTVIDATGEQPVILRPGPVTLADVEAVLTS